jgi:hypothetical protein
MGVFVTSLLRRLLWILVMGAEVVSMVSERVRVVIRTLVVVGDEGERDGAPTSVPTVGRWWVVVLRRKYERAPGRLRKFEEC